MSRKFVYLFVSFCFFFSTVSFSQDAEDMEKKRAEYEKKAMEDLYEAIKIFTNELDADDFQKEILRQKIKSYYTSRIAIYNDPSLKPYQKEEYVLQLNATHFSDISNLYSEDVMSKVQLFIKDGGQTLEKEKKKRNKKNSKKN